MEVFDGWLTDQRYPPEPISLIRLGAASPHSSEASAPTLAKRPVAFRVPRVVDDKLSATEWRLFSSEHEAREASYEIGADYQGLYVRDGT